MFKGAHESWSDMKGWKLLKKISASLMPGTYYPEPPILTGRAFEMNPYDITSVFLGMSPYPNLSAKGKRNACGYAFAIEDRDRPFDDWPASLRQIAWSINALADGVIDPSLDGWRNQGVLLLNSALTCVKGDPASHLALWKPFTTEVVKYITSLPGCTIWYLMGNEAASFEKYINTLKDVVIKGEHPASAAYQNRQMDHKFHLFGRTFQEINNKEFVWI